MFCGDFNAPRGGEVFDQLASHYSDCVPPEITTTIDQELHRAKGLQYVVDSIFSTDQYRLEDVRVQSGVSDHCALIGRVCMEARQAARDSQIDYEPAVA